MVVRNEANRYLKQTLECVEELKPDLFFVTDDFSTDGSEDLCLQAGAITHRSQTRFIKHEGQFRNEHLAALEELVNPGDWILHLDADETIDGDVRAAVDEAERFGLGAITLPLYEFWEKDKYRVDGYWYGTQAPRLFRWEEGGRVRDVEMACGSNPTYVQEFINKGKALEQDDLRLLHWGYMRMEDRLEKWNRYNDRPGHNPDHVNSIIKPATLRRYEV